MKSGSRVGVHRTARVFASLLAAGFAALLLPGLAHAQTGTVAFSQSTYSAAVSQSNAPITVIFSGTTDQTASVFFTTSDGSAMAGVAYVAVSNTVNFAGGILTNTVNVPLLNNNSPGSTQTVNLALSNPLGSASLGIPFTAVLSIINNEIEQLQFSQASYSVDDTDTVATITLVRIGATNGIVTVNFATSDGSAQAGVDYTMTTGTVTFADGMVTNTIDIPILPPGPLETNKTVNLTLSVPTAGATLGSPIHAQLIVVATGPQVIQLSAGAINVHEHVGHATVTAIRFGNADTQDTVDYATSDGTASNGADYFSTNGTLVFPVGVARSSFSFAFQKFKTFQSNKTVNVTLSNPVGGIFGTPTTAVVTIVNDEPQTITFTNAGGGVVTLLLKSAGTMQPLSLEPLNLVLEATDSGTTLSMKVKKTKGGGTGTLEIDQITGAGGCRLIDARDFDVIGSGIQLGDILSQLRIHDLLNGASLSAAGAVGQNTSITAHNVDDDAVITLGSRLSKLSAARIGVGVTIAAPAISSISVKGDKRNAIVGDFGGSITVSGDGIATNMNALGKLAVSGTISNASIVVSNGCVGSISALQMIDSQVFVGYTPTDPSNPLASGTFIADLRLGSVNISSKANGFVNSDLAASIVGGVKLSSVVPANGGLVFGVAASQHVGSVTVKTPPFHFMPNSPSNDQSLGDFHVLR